MVFRIFGGLIRALRIWYHGSAGDESPNKDDVKTVDDLPSSCLRGLRLKNWIVGDLVATEAFIPDPKTAEYRQDGGSETSVNWEDDASVLDFTLANRSAAQHGAAQIDTVQINHISRNVKSIAMPLLCERKQTEKNPYHGNIVYAATAPKYLQKLLAASLALNSKLILPSK